MSLGRNADPGILHGTLRPALCVAAAGLAIFAATKLPGCNDSDPQITPQSTVDHIKIATEAPLIDVTGRTSVTATEQAHVSLFGVGGDIPGTKKRSCSTITGQIEVRAERNGIKLAAFRLPADSSKAGATDAAPKWGIKATVDTDKIELQPSFGTLFKKGKPQVCADQEVLAFPTSDGVAKRTALAEAGGQIHFMTECGKQALSTLPAGVKAYVRDIVTTAAAIPDSLPNGHDEAELMRQMVKDPQNSIRVVFTHHVKLVGGQEIVRPIDPTKIDLRVLDTFVAPSRVVRIHDTEKAMTELIGSNDGVDFDTGEPCAFSGEAAQELYSLSGNNSANPAGV